MYFCISKETMSRLEKRNETLLAIDGQEIEKSLMLPDRFGLNKEICLKIWKGDYDDKTINMIVKDENDLEMIYTQECIFVAMKREISEETGLDLDKIPCDLKYLGYDKKILATDGIITHVFLVIFDSYDFVPYSRETEKGNSLIGMSPNEIIKRIREDEKREDINEKYFTPTIHNVFKEVNGYCKPIRQKMILFGGPNSGLSYGVKKCVEFFSEIGLEVSSTLTIPESYRVRKGLKDGHLSIRNLFPTHFIKENNKVIHQTRVMLAYDALEKLLHGKIESDVGNVPVVISEKSTRCVNMFNIAHEIPKFPLDHLMKPCDPNRLDIHVSPLNNDLAFSRAIERRYYSPGDQEVYQKTYETYDKFSHVEYPNRVIVRNDLGKESENFFVNNLTKAIKDHKSFGKLVNMQEHTQKIFYELQQKRSFKIDFL